MNLVIPPPHYNSHAWPLMGKLIKAKLYPLKRSFQRCMTCLNWKSLDPYFMGFSGWEWNCQFNYHPLFWSYISLNSQLQMNNANPLSIFKFQYLYNGILKTQIGPCLLLACLAQKFKTFVGLQFPDHLGMYIIWQCLRFIFLHFFTFVWICLTRKTISWPT
jgi:hypothetical protein